MSNNDKKFSAREAAQAVLAKAYQVRQHKSQWNAIIVNTK